MTFDLRGMILPCFEVAELLGDDPAGVDAEAVAELLRQVGVRGTCQENEYSIDVLKDFG